MRPPAVVAFFCTTGGGGVVRSFETVQGFASIQYQFLGETELDSNLLETFSKAEKAEKWGEGGERMILL